MGVIRGALLVIVSVLFFLSVFLAGLAFTIASSLQYDNLKTELIPVIKNFTGETLNLNEQLEQIYPAMVLSCKNNVGYVFTYGEYTLTFPCEVIMQGSDEVIDYGLDQILEEIYYQEYDCSFFDCFKQGKLPTFIISEKTRTFLNNKFYILLVASIALAGLMFFLVEKKANMAVVSGALITIASFPFMKLSNMSSLAGKFAGIVNIFFSNSFYVFIRMLIIGVIILALGIILKIFNIGFAISDFFAKIKPGKKEEKVKTKKEADIKPGKKEVIDKSKKKISGKKNLKSK